MLCVSDGVLLMVDPLIYPLLSGYEQQDAHEFFIAVLDLLHRHLIHKEIYSFQFVERISRLEILTVTYFKDMNIRLDAKKYFI